MNNRTKYIAAIAVVLVLAIGGSLSMNYSEYLQGSFPGSAATWAVDASSPSGTHSTSVTDSIFVFDVTAPTTRDVKFGDGTHFDFTFTSSTGSLDAVAPAGALVELVTSTGNPIAFGYIATNDQGENNTAAWASLYFRNPTWNPVQTSIAAGATETYTLKVDSTGLMGATSSIDNSLVVSMNYKTVNLTGGTLHF